MKPIRLTMTAFGPYKEKQVIDFREIEEYQLFVISGKTGAGKTTMFDAICYALYGEANGEDRSDSKMLRSHFAEDHTYTSVELDFEIKGRTYQVLRQMPHVKQGNKTPSGGQVALYETSSGTAVPCVDRFHVNDVNKKLGELIGLTKDQFTQIVMLPQGEFRKLLTSDTENKEEVLRRIFKTEAFKRVREILDGRRKEAQAQTSQLRAEVGTVILNISSFLPIREDSPLAQTLSKENYNTYQIIQGLVTEIGYYAEREKELQEAKDLLRSQLQAKEKEYYAAKAINDRFVELDSKENQKQWWEQRLPEYQAKEAELKKAERASLVIPYEEQYISAAEQVSEKKAQVERTRKEAEQATEKRLHAQQKYELEKSKEHDRERSRRELQQLEEMQPVFQGLEAKRMQLLHTRKQERELAESFLAAERIWQQRKEQHIKLNKEIAELDRKTREFPAAQRLLIDLAEKEKGMQEYVRLAQEEQQFARFEYEHRHLYETASKAYDEVEAQWIQGQASLLSMHLQDGSPCPVCGSLVHPDKAVVQEKMPTKELLESGKKDRDEKAEGYHRVKTKLEVTKKALDQARTHLDTLGVSQRDIPRQLDDLLRRKSTLTIQLGELEKAHETLLESKEKLSFVQREVEKSEEEKEHFLRQHQEMKVLLASETAVFETMRQTLPDGIQTIQALEQRLRDARELQSRLAEHWQQAQESLQLTIKKEIAVQTDLKNVLAQLEEWLASYRQAEERYLNQLAGGGFETDESYQLAKRSVTQQESLRKDIDHYKTSLQSLRIQVAEMRAELQNKVRCDLEGMLADFNALEEKNQQLLHSYHSIVKHREDASKIKENLINSSRGLEHKENALRLISDLFEMVKGDNEQRLSFERYLQIEFLELIIQAANVRLNRITNGQFHLERSGRLERQGRQSGLGLDVYDSYTGQARDVKSLSGGEKFKASLCLALGLADVIQSYEGGITIQTMFIDEGFGSLDEESLSEAVDTLVELQKSGRMIGVISHVQELKAAIPAVLEVYKTREGFSSAKFVIK